MRIEHVAVWTHDIDRLASFYARYFAATIGPRYVNSPKGFESRFLSFESGARIEIMQSATLGLERAERGAQCLGYTHLAVAVGSEAQVDALTKSLRQDGYEILADPRRTGDGYNESVVLDPDGNRIEITV